MKERGSLGFWLYLMTDCMLFASLFAVFAVLRTATADGPTANELFELPMVLGETFILLTSSFTCGVGVLLLRRKQLVPAVSLLIITYLLGIAFLVIELTEFTSIIDKGFDWGTSAFLSSFFVLVGTHGLHIFIGLLWLLILIALLVRQGITDNLLKKAGLFALFWHFLDLVWIFIFTFVYLLGVAA